jgi:hypothetical protein
VARQTAEIIAKVLINDEKTFLHLPEKPEYGIAFYVAVHCRPSSTIVQYSTRESTAG